MNYEQIKNSIQKNPKLFLHFAKASGYTDEQLKELKTLLWRQGINPNRGSGLANSYMEMLMTLRSQEYNSFDGEEEEPSETHPSL